MLHLPSWGEYIRRMSETMRRRIRPVDPGDHGGDFRVAAKTPPRGIAR